jgi:hypothetical protein
VENTASRIIGIMIFAIALYLATRPNAHLSELTGTGFKGLVNTTGALQGREGSSGLTNSGLV